MMSFSTYDTLEVLRAKKSVDFQDSLDVSIAKITLPLFKIYSAFHNESHSKERRHDFFLGSDYECEEGLIMPPSLVILEASQKLFRILCKIDTSVLAPILSIEKAESLRNNRFNVFDSLSRLNPENGCQRNKSINIFHLLRSLSRDLSRIKYQLEEFIYWADDVLLASLASSDRGERLVNDDDRARDYKFAALIDTCADVVQAGWMILGQISKANEFTSGSLRLYQAKINQKRVTVTSRAQLLKSTQTRGSIRSKVSKASLSQIHRCLKTRAATLSLYRQKDSLRRSFSRFTKFINPKGVSVSIKVAKSYLKLIK